MPEQLNEHPDAADSATVTRPARHVDPVVAGGTVPGNCAIETRWVSGGGDFSSLAGPVIINVVRGGLVGAQRPAVTERRAVRPAPWMPEGQCDRPPRLGTDSTCDGRRAPVDPFRERRGGDQIRHQL